MANENMCVLMGNLTRDPELRFTPQGTAICKMGIAVNRQFKNAAGELQKEVQFFTIVVWNKTGENCAKFLAKGRPVYVRGRLQNRSWKTADGENRTTTEIVADMVQFLQSGGSNGGNGGGASGETSHQEDAEAAGQPEQGQFDDGVPF